MILAIETATDICGAALVHHGKIVASQSVKERTVHSEQLLPMIHAVLHEANIALSMVDAIAVSIGPGSFTGLRIGVSTAKGLAYGTKKPLIPVPTLNALAQSALLQQNSANEFNLLCPTIDAKRNELFYAFFRAENSALARISEYSIGSPEQIASEAADRGKVLVCGESISSFDPLQLQSSDCILQGNIFCSPVAVGLIAEQSGELLKKEQYAYLDPLYIRDFFVKSSSGRIKVGSQKL